MPSYGYDYQLIKVNTVKELKCRVCGKKMKVKRGIYSGNSIMAIILGKSGVFDEFCCEYSGESWHETAMEAVKDAEQSINQGILKTMRSNWPNN